MTVVFLQDGASLHYAVVLGQYLDQNLSNRWIGREGPNYLHLRLADLTPSSYFSEGV